MSTRTTPTKKRKIAVSAVIAATASTLIPQARAVDAVGLNGVLAVVGNGPQSNSGDLFRATVKNTDNNTTKSQTGSSLENLIRNAVQSRGEFAGFEGANIQSSLSYGGVGGFLKFEQHPAVGVNGQYVGILSSDLLPGREPVRRTASTQDGLGEEFVKFFRKDGSSYYTDLLKAISANSKVSPTDGNPNADTARNAANDFATAGQLSGQTKAEKKDGSGGTSSAFRVDADYGTFKADGIEAKTYALPLSKQFTFSDRVGLNLGVPLSYTDIGGAKVYSGGLNVAVPIEILKKSSVQPLTWRLTPFGGGSVTASREMITGGVVGRGGLGNLLAYDFGAFEIAMGNQISQHKSIEVEIAGTKVDPGVDQQILKNGLQICVPVAEHWILEGYAIHTQFLGAAGVKHYVTYGGDIGFRLGKNKSFLNRIVGNLRLGAYSDTGSGFSSTHFKLGSSWNF
jgi:hypothetical protein